MGVNRQVFNSYGISYVSSNHPSSRAEEEPEGGDLDLLSAWLNG